MKKINTNKKSEKAITLIESLIILAVILLVGAGIYQIFFTTEDEVYAEVYEKNTLEVVNDSNVGNQL